MRLQNIIKSSGPSTTKDEASFLLLPFSDARFTRMVPSFYLTPKIHKEPLKGRPIVASHSWCLKNVAIFLDRHLQPMVKKLPNVLHNTLPLLRQLSQAKFPSNCLFATADVASLYTNIPHELGLEAVRCTLVAAGVPLVRVQLLCQLIELVLTNNYFEFRNQLYHQLSGTAMGSQMAPCYANIVMHHLEKDWFLKHRRQILLYRRYLDDLFVIFNTKVEEAQQAMEDFNLMHPKIQVTSIFSFKMVSFLDLSIYKGSQFSKTKNLEVKSYSKSYAQFLYLPFASFHPVSTKIAMIKGEAIRLLRNNSNKQNFNEAAQRLKKHLQARGYPKHFIESGLHGIFFQDRALHLQPSNKENNEDAVNLKLPYSGRQVLNPKDLVEFCKSAFDCKINTVWMPAPSLSNHLVSSHCE